MGLNPTLLENGWERIDSDGEDCRDQYRYIKDGHLHLYFVIHPDAYSKGFFSRPGWYIEVTNKDYGNGRVHGPMNTAEEAAAIAMILKEN